MLSGKLCEHLAVVGVADPYVVINAELWTDFIDMSKWEQVMFICVLGNVNDKTFDFDVHQSTDSSGSDEVSLKAATQLAAHATANDNDQVIINIRREELTDGFTHIRCGMLSEAAQDGPVCIIALGGNASYNNAADNDLASVVEIKD